MCKEVLARLSDSGKLYGLDIVLLTFAVTTALERLPSAAQVSFMAIVVVALSELGASISRNSLQHLTLGHRRKEAVVAGIGFLLVHFTAGAIEGVAGMRRGATLTAVPPGESFATLLAVFQWVLPFAYAILLLRWLAPGLTGWMARWRR